MTLLIIIVVLLFAVVASALIMSCLFVGKRSDERQEEKMTHKILQYILRFVRYMNNKAWFMCHVVYKDYHPRGRPYLTWKQAMSGLTESKLKDSK